MLIQKEDLSAGRIANQAVEFSLPGEVIEAQSQPYISTLFGDNIKYPMTDSIFASVRPCHA